MPSDLRAPPHDLVFFIDRDLGSRTFPAILRAAGLRAEAHNDHFPDARRPETSSCASVLRLYMRCEEAQERKMGAPASQFER